MSLEFLRASSVQTWCRLQPSPLHGVGVFAVRRIPPKTDIFPECKDFFVTQPIEHLEKLDPALKEMCLDYFYSDDSHIFLPWKKTLNTLNISFFLNYSESPNCIHHPDGTICSLDWIEIGEELTHSYE